MACEWDRGGKKTWMPVHAFCSPQKGSRFTLAGLLARKGQHVCCRSLHLPQPRRLSGRSKRRVFTYSGGTAPDLHRTSLLGPSWAPGQGGRYHESSIANNQRYGAGGTHDESVGGHDEALIGKNACLSVTFTNYACCADSCIRPSTVELAVTVILALHTGAPGRGGAQSVQVKKRRPSFIPSDAIRGNPVATWHGLCTTTNGLHIEVVQLAAIDEYACITA